MLSVIVIMILIMTNIITGALLVTAIQDYDQIEGWLKELVAYYSEQLDEYRKEN